MSVGAAVANAGASRDRARAIGLLGVSVLAISGALVTAFRLRPEDALGFGLAAQGPRVLLAVAVGGALAASASLARERGRDLLERELLLLGASAGGALGGALAAAAAGFMSPAFGLVGAVLGALLLRAL